MSVTISSDYPDILGPSWFTDISMITSSTQILIVNICVLQHHDDHGQSAVDQTVKVKDSN